MSSDEFDLGGEQFNLGKVHEAVAGAIPDRQCLVWRDRRLTFSEVTDRSRRLASFLHRHGLGAHREREELAPHESGQDHLAIYLYNCNEYIEVMLGSYKARVAPFNVNYRYVEEELCYLMRDARARAIVFHATFAPVLEHVLGELPELELLIQVSDDSGHGLLPGAVDYEDALASAPAELPPVEPRADDLYILYTGGTTGMPKGVLWRQHDIFIAAMGGRAPLTWEEARSYSDLVSAAATSGPLQVMPVAPLMHGAAQWTSFIFMTRGGTVVMPDETRHVDPADVWRTVQREHVNLMAVVGDSMARPLAEELERHRYDTSSLAVFGSGGAVLSPGMKERLISLCPGLVVSDAAGASETGPQMAHQSVQGAVASGHFAPAPGAVVLDDALSALLAPGDGEIGWLAQRGHVPLGYLGDPDKTARTFPVVDGVRYSVPGDRARVLADGEIELLGRDSVTINSGGEKIFAEEVEQAIIGHPAVADVVVAGRPSERWGQEVVALVQLAEGCTATASDLVDAAGRHIARYKLPKAIAFVPRVMRSPAGKADYRWAREQALDA